MLFCEPVYVKVPLIVTFSKVTAVVVVAPLAVTEPKVSASAVRYPPSP